MRAVDLLFEAVACGITAAAAADGRNALSHTQADINALKQQAGR